MEEKMIILALLIGALSLYVGYKWGFGKGLTELERRIVSQVVNSPHYSETLADGILKSLKRARR